MSEQIHDVTHRRHTLLVTLPELDRSISRSYIAESLQHPRYEGYFLGIWAVPGISRDYVRLPGDGTTVLFNSVREALNAAREAGYHYLNEANRASNFKRRNERITGPEFAGILGELPVSRVDFATLWGCETDRIWGWENGRDVVPFPFWWLLPELKDEALVADALEIARAHSQHKE